MSDSKRMKHDISSSASSTADGINKKSLLSEYVQVVLQRGMKEGYKDSNLNLASRIDDSMMHELCEYLIKLEGKVKKLDLSKNQITSTGASMLFDMLRITNSSIKIISLSYNYQVDDKCMKSVGEYIKSNTSIEGIDMSCTSVSDKGIKILAPHLEGNATFKWISLSGNKRITDKSIPLLMKMIESSHIEDIGVLITSISQKGIIYSSLASNTFKYGWNSLSLYGKDLNDDDLIKICDSMKKYGIDKLREINLNNNYITSKGASVLFDTLRECKSVVSKLILSHNKIYDECMKQLGEYLQDNEHLEKLDISFNKMTDKGIEVLSEYWIGNITLKELYLNFNKLITDVSVPHFVEIVKQSCIVKTDLLGTSISEEKHQEIGKALRIAIEQREIPIKSNTKSAAKISLSAST